MRPWGLAAALVAAATGCTPPSSNTCAIGGKMVSAGAVDPQNVCQGCLPQVRSDAWSELPPGSPCGDAGAICSSGSCQEGCWIAPLFYKSGSSNPATECETCQPETDRFGWSPFVGFGPGLCPSGEYCSASGCRSGCFIEGQELEPDTVDSTNSCRSCQPSSTPGDWTPLLDGAACDAGAICLRGACEAACAIDGQIYSPGATNPANPCLSCLPDQSSVSWTPISGLVGSACEAAVCDRGACRPGCFIDGGFEAPGFDPANPCLLCAPDTSLSSWASARDGTPCASSSFCSGGSCLAGCFIGGVFYPPGQAQPGDPCKICSPTSCHHYDWGDAPSGTPCAAGGMCMVGQCTTPPFACLPTGAVCGDGSQACCSDLANSPYGGCGDAGRCECMPLNVYFGIRCHSPEPACCSTVCVQDVFDFNIGFCSCYDPGTPCRADVQCCSGCCSAGSCA